MGRLRTNNGSRLKALDETELPRRDSAIVVGVTAAIVGLLVLWMTQAGATSQSAAASDAGEIRENVAEESAAPITIDTRGTKPNGGLRENLAGE